MRPSTIFITGTAVCITLLALLLFAYPRSAAVADRAISSAANRKLVKELGLTDICLFTEARYTRHVSQADLHAPFQDHPGSRDYFPSGSLLLPPQYLHGGDRARD